MPWVRLHGTKDYWGMAMLLREAPEMRATINLVPSLLVQLQAYTDAGHEDTHLRVARMAPEALGEQELYYLLDNFFMVHPDHMIRPYPRYNELYQKRGLSIDSAERARKRFSKRDLLDLQCWGNLAWFHPLAFEQDAELAAFRDKGRHWTQDEKLWLLEKQMEILRQVVPLHRELQDRGQIELTTTPFYHPILPLLLDKRLARRAMPDVGLPKHLEGFGEDAVEQIRRAVAFHEKLFGEKPRGMWPSEGSVCQEVVPHMADAGLHWIATDEEILSCSTDGWVSRDGNGFLRNPEMLYRPWRVEHQGKQLQLVFRDHAMSDQIGFHYQRYMPDHAVDDFIGKLEAIGNATNGNAGRRPSLVSIVLDGENCWEYYHNSGVDFLRTLYRRLLKHPKIKTTRVCDYLKQYPATDRIGNLFPGSWIQHNFGIWIGHPECNQAWDQLYQTRQFLVQAAKQKQRSAESVARAWQELFIAEGSDWFWWFGDSHSSAQDALFDRLFRKHLQNVYTVLGEEPPSELARPISQSHTHTRAHTQPTGLLEVKINGRRSYFKWINAGRYSCQTGRGTMNMANTGLIGDLYFGFDPQRLLLRLDCSNGPAREQLADVDAVRVVFLQPASYEVQATLPIGKKPGLQLRLKNTLVPDAGVEAASEVLFELGVPLRKLAAKTADPVRFYVELLRRKQSVERIPREGAIETNVPSPDFELIMWQA
jgi:alpha-amylase/alpha-mannosidase (GH57 family)